MLRFALHDGHCGNHALRAMLCVAVLVWIATGTARAQQPAEIVVIRGESGCPGIPGLDVRLDGTAPAILGVSEHLRFPVTPGEHHLVFYPANPENIAVVAGEQGRHGYLVTSFRLGWRCKFGVEPIEGEALAELLGRSKEVPLALARTTDRPLADDRGQLILKQP